MKKKKIEKHQDLKRGIKNIWNMRTVKVQPVIAGALESIRKKLNEKLEKLGIIWITNLYDIVVRNNQYAQKSN